MAKRVVGLGQGMSSTAAMTPDFTNAAICQLRWLWGEEAIGCLSHVLRVQCCKVTVGKHRPLRRR